MARKLIETVVGTLGTVKVYRDAEWDEYRAVLVGSPDSTAFDDDKESIMGTARMLAGLEVMK